MSPPGGDRFYRVIDLSHNTTAAEAETLLNTNAAHGYPFDSVLIPDDGARTLLLLKWDGET